MKYLAAHWDDERTIARIPTRDGFGRALLELGSTNHRVVALCADLAESTRVHWFRDIYPHRYIEMGVMEQNMAGVAAGLAVEGFIPFITSYAVFSPGRNWDQIRVSACYNHANVKIVGAHAGLSVGPDGATHQALEDIALMRVLPGMTVVVPADSVQAGMATHALAALEGPAYIRLTREKTPVFMSPSAPFELGKAQLLRPGTDIVIVGCGPILYEALMCAHELEKKGISVAVLNMHTVKPLDTHALRTLTKKVNGIVTVEEHQVHGGLFSAVAQWCGEHHPLPIAPVAVMDTFGESGTPEELAVRYGLTREHIAKACKTVLQ